MEAVDAKSVAQEALAMLESDKERSFIGFGGHEILTGYFKGVISGNITVGQSWLVHMIKDNSWRKEDYPVLAKVVESGMCCEGQQLYPDRGKGFVSRESR